MKSILLVLALPLAVLSSPRSTAACDSHSPRFHISKSDDAVRWAPRHDARGARFAITSEDGKVELMIDRGRVVAQLSDRGFRDVRREMRKDRDREDDGVLASVIQSVVFNAVESALDHGAEVRVRDLRSVNYEDGALVFTTEDGERIFDNIQIDDQDLGSGFSERDAKAFVREFRREKARRG